MLGQDAGKPRMGNFPVEQGYGWMNDQALLGRGVERWEDVDETKTDGDDAGQDVKKPRKFSTMPLEPGYGWMNDKDIIDRSVKRFNDVDQTKTGTDGDDAGQDVGKPRKFS